MDEIFHAVSGWKGAFTVVKVAKEMPRRYGKRGELLIPYEDTEAAYETEGRRRSSIARQSLPGEKGMNGYGAGSEKVEGGR